MSSIYNSVCRASYRQYDASCFFLARVATLLAHPSISYWGLSVPQTRGLGRDPEGFDIQTSELQRALPIGIAIWEGVQW